MNRKPDKQTRAAIASAIRELDALHREWEEGLSHYHLRLKGQFKELRRRLEPNAAAKRAKGPNIAPAARRQKHAPPPVLPDLPSGKEAREILEDLDKARLKPAKGRSKDLRRVEDALDRAIGRLRPL